MDVCHLGTSSGKKSTQHSRSDALLETHSTTDRSPVFRDGCDQTSFSVRKEAS